MFHSVPPLNSVRPSGRIDIGPSLATTTPSLASISAGSSANGATVCVPPSATPNVVASPAAQHAPYSLSWSRVVNSSDSATVGGGRATAQAISLTSTSEPVDRTVRVTRTGTAVSATIVLSLVRPSATRTESARSTTGAGPSPSDGTYYGYGYSPNVHSLAASPASLLQPLPAPFHPTSSLVPVFTPETVGGAYGGGYGGVPLDSVPSSSEATETRTLTRTTARPVSNSTQPANASGTSAADAQQTTANPYGPPNGYVYGAPFSDAAAAPAPTSEPDPGTPYDSDSLSPGDQTNTLDDGSNDDGSNDDSSNDDSSNDDPGIVRRGGRTAAAVNPESRSGAHRNVATAAALTLGGLLFLAAL
ncbi:MAG: hypothetical protein M1826_006521 [Phylliscum demangeonii]|nr:MAG: hypothetical protein M1826_006521 [Phylliscum demangeonii]